MSAEYVNISDLSELGDITPPGDYTVKLINVIPKKTKANSLPMLELHYEVDGGDYDGNSIRQWLTLNTFQTKSGKTVSPSISEIKNLRNAVGAPIPANFNFPLDENKAGKELKQVFGKKLLARVSETSDKNDAEKKFTRIKIIGTPDGAVVREGENPLANFA